MAKQQDPIRSIDLEELTYVSGGTARDDKAPRAPNDETAQPPRRPSFGRVINGMLGGD